MDILLDFLKLLTSLMFLIFGYSVSAQGLALHAVRWFAIGATMVAVLGIALSALNIHAFDSVLYYGFVRYRGLMIDPNYYAVLTCAAVVYFLRDRSTWPALRIVALVALLYSLVISGSKTGTIALLMLFGVMVLGAARRSRYALPLSLMLAAVGTVIVATWSDVGRFIAGIAKQYGTAIPQLNRIADLFNGPLDAASAGGSDRLTVWNRGVHIIETSPLVGSGIGSYGNVVEATSGIGTLAHNTYIQVAAEWGLPFALILFTWIGRLLLKASTLGEPRSREAIILRDIVLVFLVGSISLSLNNARMFWFFLGALAFVVVRKRVIQRQSRANMDQRMLT